MMRRRSLLLLDRKGTVFLLNQGTCFEHLSHKTLSLLSGLELTLALSQLTLQSVNSSIFVRQSGESVLLLGSEFVDFGSGSPSFIAYLEHHTRRAFLCGDGGGVFDDVENLWINLNVEVLSLSQGLVTRINSFSNKVGKRFPNHGVNHVQDPLNTHEISVRIK